MTDYFGPEIRLETRGLTQKDDVYEVSWYPNARCVMGHPQQALSMTETDPGEVWVCRACAASWFKQRKPTYRIKLACETPRCDQNLVLTIEQGNARIMSFTCRNGHTTYVGSVPNPEGNAK
jgi:hypothetical protein